MEGRKREENEVDRDNNLPFFILAPIIFYLLLLIFLAAFSSSFSFKDFYYYFLLPFFAVSGVGDIENLPQAEDRK
jgi:hypothetical protein